MNLQAFASIVACSMGMGAFMRAMHEMLAANTMPPESRERRERERYMTFLHVAGAVLMSIAWLLMR